MKKKKYAFGGLTPATMFDFSSDLLIGTSANAVTQMFDTINNGPRETRLVGQNTGLVMANGGVVPAEVEGGETFKSPDGNVGEFQGPTHENGGVHTQLEPGTKIFSDRVTIDGEKAADRMKKRERKQNRLKKLLDKNHSDKLLKGSYQRTKDLNKMEESFDMKQQEAVNNLEKLIGQVGGEVKYKNGGTVDFKEGFYANGTPENGVTPTIDSEESLKDFLTTAYGSNDAEAVKKLQSAIIESGYDLKGGADGLIGPSTLGYFGTEGASDFVSGLMPKPEPTTPDPIDMQTIGPPTSVGPSLTKQVRDPLATELSALEQGLPIAEMGTTPPSLLDGQLPTAPYDLKGNSFLGKLAGAANSADKFIGKTASKFWDALTKDRTNDDNSSNSGDNMPYLTRGDKMGLAGNLQGKYLPLANTLINDMRTPPNQNMYLDFGTDALRLAEEVRGTVALNRDQGLRDMQLAQNTSTARNRNSARSVNVQRGLDSISELSAQKGNAQVRNTYANQMMQLAGQQMGLENQRDQMVMSGEEKRDLADRQDVDNFHTQLAQNLSNISEFTQKTGSDLNKAQYNEDFLNSINQLSNYGIGYERQADGSLKLVKLNKETKKTK